MEKSIPIVMEKAIGKQSLTLATSLHCFPLTSLLGRWPDAYWPAFTEGLSSLPPSVRARVFCKFISQGYASCLTAMRKDSAWGSIIREAYAASRGLGVPTIGMDDGYVLYSTAFLVSLWFGWLKAMDAGAGVGFSTVWIARAILESGIDGNVYAVEKTSRRFRSLKSLVAKHHLESLITPVNGDAFDHARKVEELNLVFIDIEKEQYLEFFRLIESRIPSGGVVLAHNVNHPYGTVEAFLKEASQGVWRTIIVPTQAGISISIKTG